LKVSGQAVPAAGPARGQLLSLLSHWQPGPGNREAASSSCLLRMKNNEKLMKNNVSIIFYECIHYDFESDFIIIYIIISLVQVFHYW
jgi:hypothetical protein